MTDTTDTAGTNADEAGRLDGVLRIAGWGTAGVMFAIPAIAMTLTREVNWDAADFAAWGIMLLTACLLGEGVLRAYLNWPARAGAILSIAAGFLLVWVNLAVGFIGDGINQYNAVYLAMPIGVVAAGALARFRANVMQWLLIGCALVQLAIPVAASESGRFEWIATTVFCALWLGAAGLFRKSLGFR